MALFDIFKKKKSEGKTAGPRYAYTSAGLEQLGEFITERYGEFDNVFHEIYSPDIHLDVAVVPPNGKGNYYKLITMGMGAYKMNVPAELKDYALERAELVMYLPADWNLQSDKPEDYWPVRELKNAARLPVSCDTWLGLGHTVSSNENNDPYAPNTGFCSLLLLNACDSSYDRLDFNFKNGDKVNFYQLFPLYKEELEFKRQTDIDTLLDRFPDEDIVPVVNVQRKNYCK